MSCWKRSQQESSRRLSGIRVASIHGDATKEIKTEEYITNRLVLKVRHLLRISSTFIGHVVAQCLTQTRFIADCSTLSSTPQNSSWTLKRGSRDWRILPHPPNSENQIWQFLTVVTTTKSTKKTILRCVQFVFASMKLGIKSVGHTMKAVATIFIRHVVLHG